MARRAWVVVVWSICAVGVAAEPRPVVRAYFTDGAIRGAVVRAVLGARLRLSRTGCRRVLTDFTDPGGRSLVASLDATGLEASEYVTERIWFVDGSDEPACVKPGETAAFTAVGSRVVHVCAARFARFRPHSAAAEVVLIHEILHTLGLGENPPSSAEITRQVTARCGRG